MALMDRGQKLWSLDIETVTQGKRALDYTDNMTYKTGNVKDPEKKAAKIVEKRAEAANKHALNWATGKVLSFALVDVHNHENCVTCFNDNEEILLEELRHDLKGSHVVGKSGKSFDYPFLVGRYLYHDMEVPSVLKDRYRLHDIDDWLTWDKSSSQRSTLDQYAHGLGLDGKPMSGADVAGLYNEWLHAYSKGNFKECERLEAKLLDYNLYDSMIVAIFAKRYLKGSIR